MILLISDGIHTDTSLGEVEPKSNKKKTQSGFVNEMESRETAMQRKG